MQIKMTEKITYDNLPEAVQELHKKIDRLLTQVHSVPQPEADRLLTIEELRDYLPECPARQTIYGWVNERNVPYEKYGRKLYFRKSAIDTWVNNGRRVN